MRNHFPCCIIDPTYPNIAAFAEHYDYDLLGQPISVFRQSMRDPLTYLRVFLQNNQHLLGFMPFCLLILMYLISWFIRNAHKIWLFINLVHRVLKDHFISKEKLDQSKDESGYQAADDFAAVVYRAFTGFRGVYEGATHRPIPVDLDDFEAVRFVCESNLVQSRVNQRLLWAYRSVSRQFPRVYPAGESFSEDMREKVDKTMVDMEAFPVTQPPPEGAPPSTMAETAAAATALAKTDKKSKRRESVWSERMRSIPRKRFKTMHRSTLIRAGTYSTIDDEYLAELHSRNIRDPYDNLRFRHKSMGLRLSRLSQQLKRPPPLSKEERQRLDELKAWTEEYRKRVKQAEEEAKRGADGNEDQTAKSKQRTHSQDDSEADTNIQGTSKKTKSAKTKRSKTTSRAPKNADEAKRAEREARMESLRRFQPTYFTYGASLPQLKESPDLDRIPSPIEKMPFRQYIAADRLKTVPTSPLKRSKTCDDQSEVQSRLFKLISEDEAAQKSQDSTDENET